MTTSNSILLAVNPQLQNYSRFITYGELVGDVDSIIWEMNLNQILQRVNPGYTQSLERMVKALISGPEISGYAFC